MGELFLSHNIFYALNGYGAVYIGKKRRRISMMPMEKVRQFTKPRTPSEPVRSYLFSTTI